MAILSTMKNTRDMDIQKLTNLFETLSLSTSSQSILTTINTMDLDFEELIDLLENFSISTSPKSTLPTINSMDIQNRKDLTEDQTASIATNSIQDYTTNTVDFQELIDLLDNFSISLSSKFTLPLSTNTMNVQRLMDFTEVESASIATTSTGTRDSIFDSLSTILSATSASSVLSSSQKPIDFIDFNDRSPEARDARLANFLLSLDEDIPQDVDDTIKILLKNHTTGAMKFDDHYLEYKQQMATKRFTEKKLPTSKARSTRQKSPSPNNHTIAL